MTDSAVFGRFRPGDETIARARALAEGEKHEPTSAVRFVDRDGQTIAEVDKTRYVSRARVESADGPGPIAPARLAQCSLR